jgi:hypothetical protein
MLQAMGVQKTVSVNPNNQKEMNEESEIRRAIRLDAQDNVKCDSCLKTENCCTFRFAIKDVNLCGECFVEFWDALAAGVHAGMEDFDMKKRGYRKAPDGYQPEPDIHDIEMVGSELWIKDKEESK